LEAAEIEVEGYLIKPLTPAVLDDKVRTIVHQINHPDMAALHIRKARDFEEKKDFYTAVEHMKHAAALKPAASRVMRKLGLLYQKTGDEKAMEKCLLKAAGMNHQDAVTRQLLGEMYWEKKDWIAAARYYLEAISLTRKFFDRAVDLGEVLLDKKLARMGKNIFSKVITKSSKNLPVKQKILDICIRQNELEYANHLLNSLTRDFPSNYDLIYKNGVVCDMMGKTDKALEHFLTIEKNIGGRMDVLLKIAKLYYQKNKIIQADDYLNRVLKKDPKNKEALALRSLL